jgi:uncharacterized protein (TIGR02453 family)
MSKRKIYDFLRDLSDNNSKEWMDDNRARYHEAKDIWLQEIEQILHRLAKYNPKMDKLNPKKTIFRIVNNRMFHPDRPVYKDNFAFSPSAKEDPSFYVHLSPKESFVGGGYYRPSNDQLKKIRAAIDYDGEEFLKIVNKQSFLDFYGGLSEDAEKLKTSPRDYSVDHRHIELLRRKNFVAIRPLTQKEVISDDFIDILENAFVELQPMNAYLKRAVDFEA